MPLSTKMTAIADLLRRGSAPAGRKLSGLLGRYARETEPATVECWGIAVIGVAAIAGRPAPASLTAR